MVEVGAVAHGGHCVARHDGQVLFVRHALPGEVVVAEVTERARAGRYLRADAVEVREPSPDRREPPCPVADRCGGCDWLHATPAAARALKAEVVRESLRRFARIELPHGFRVEPVGLAGRAGDDGLHWRTRGVLSTDGQGRAGFLASRSHDVVVAGACPQLDPRLDGLGLFARAWPPNGRVRFVVPGLGDPMAFPEGEPPGEPLVEVAVGRRWAVADTGFWQVHPGAADALVEAVRAMVAPRPGERLVDLYSGVGLLGLSLAGGVPGGLRLTMVEGDREACELARRNAGDLPATVVRAGVERWVRRPRVLAGVDLVVLDPPRTGAGRVVVEALVAAAPRAVAYVACDPVALARDLATFAAGGYRLAELVAFDLFPSTQHVECVAHLVPA